MTIKKEDLRKVKVSKYDDGSGEHNINGYFHEWGLTIVYLDSKELQATCGIIELESGEVKMYSPKRLKFVEQF